MALCSLLVMPTDQGAAIGFAFDHDQLHRDFTTVLGSGSKPRLLDPRPLPTQQPAPAIGISITRTATTISTLLYLVCNSINN